MFDFDRVARAVVEVGDVQGAVARLRPVLSQGCRVSPALLEVVAGDVSVDGDTRLLAGELVAAGRDHQMLGQVVDELLTLVVLVARAVGLDAVSLLSAYMAADDLAAEFRDSMSGGGL